jgi:hypothetical protein
MVEVHCSHREILTYAFWILLDLLDIPFHTFQESNSPQQVCAVALKQILQHQEAKHHQLQPDLISFNSSIQSASVHWPTALRLFSG